jgi:hypothetical protein
MEQYKINLLKLAAKHELTSSLYWNEDLCFYINCNDLFYWGTADGEDISSQEDVDLLEQSVKDCLLISKHGDLYATELYCARRAKKRPQGAYYEHIEKSLWPLFDACGLEREVGIGNPKPQPTE